LINRYVLLPRHASCSARGRCLAPTHHPPSDLPSSPLRPNRSSSSWAKRWSDTTSCTAVSGKAAGKSAAGCRDRATSTCWWSAARSRTSPRCSKAWASAARRLPGRPRSRDWKAVSGSIAPRDGSSTCTCTTSCSPAASGPPSTGCPSSARCSDPRPITMCFALRRRISSCWCSRSAWCSATNCATH